MTLQSDAKRIYALFISYGFNDFQAKCFTAQSAHETAGWTSDVYKQNNNCFGMKYTNAGRADGKLNGYASYLSVDNSCNDMRYWYNIARTRILSLPLFINTLSDYVDFLQNQGYFEDTEENYLNGCQKYFDKLFPK